MLAHIPFLQITLSFKCCFKILFDLLANIFFKSIGINGHLFFFFLLIELEIEILITYSHT
jgi:hypothetical protein